MSAIFGVLRMDGGEVAPSVLPQMSERLAHRGPDGNGLWCDGHVALGHRMLHTTPESLRERQPVVRHDGALVVVADARVDNREELIASLALRGPVAAAPTDADLILHAYEAWGGECPARIVGDFAFAIWDRRRGSLFCARDPMGVKPFYYFRSAGVFVFASELKAIFAVPGVPKLVNELQVAYYLEPFLGDREITFYQDVRRLPAAHSLMVEPSIAQPSRFWTIDIGRDTHLADDREYAEAFLSVFRQAVESRLRSAFAVGSTVSGGLDSSSIACVARLDGRPGPDRVIHTFSAIFPGLPDAERRLADESPYIDAVVGLEGFVPHRVRADEISPFHDHERLLRHLDEPPLGYNLYMHCGLYGAAQQAGVRTFLDGVDGDACVSHGYQRLSELIYQNQWDAFESEVRALAAGRTNPRAASARLASQFVSPYLEALATSRDGGTWLRVGREASARFGLSRRRLAVRYGLQPLVRHAMKRTGSSRTGNAKPGALLLHRDLAQRVLGLRRSAEPTPADTPPELFAREAHRRALENPQYQRLLEVADHAAAMYHVEPRYPFFDRRLMEFCVSLPSDQKLSGGWTRAVLRRAMDGILPPEIQWRPGKQDLAPNFARGLRTRDREIIASAVREAPRVLDGLVDAHRLRELYGSYTSVPIAQAPESAGVALYRVAMLSRWIKDFGSVDVETPGRATAIG